MYLSLDWIFSESNTPASWYIYLRYKLSRFITYNILPALKMKDKYPI